MGDRQTDRQTDGCSDAQPGNIILLSNGKKKIGRNWKSLFTESKKEGLSGSENDISCFYFAA